jgi:hypothetical protein
MADTKEVAAAVNPALVLDEATKAKIEKAMAKVAAKRSTEAEIMEKYSNVIKGSLQFDEVAEKQSVEIKCAITDCKETRRLFTSDLHQAKTCLTHRKEARKIARQARANEQKKLIEAGKAALKS